MIPTHDFCILIDTSTKNSKVSLIFRRNIWYYTIPKIHGIIPSMVFELNIGISMKLFYHTVGPPSLDVVVPNWWIAKRRFSWRICFVLVQVMKMAKKNLKFILKWVGFILLQWESFFGLHFLRRGVAWTMDTLWIQKWVEDLCVRSWNKLG